ncbi:MAG: hypothetical protein HZC54_10865 [Verrucomicrobia bacterium]|nr:hypothetical protein [Verrucomicrobiota bacterium]
MILRIIGEPLLAKSADGKLKSRIGTVFVGKQTIVTLPGIHATQRAAYLQMFNQQRQTAGLPALTEQEEAVELSHAVDLVMEDDTVLIRPDPTRMDLAFAADEMLQEIVSKEQIKFLHVLDSRVRNAVKRRGENWRITPLPRSADDMRQMILGARIGIGGREIYYFNRETGSRFLTCQGFAALGVLEETERRRLLVEIRDCSSHLNRLGWPEVSFFMADKVFTAADFAQHDFANMPSEQLQSVFEALWQKFQNAVPEELRRDDVSQIEWRNRMYAALIGLEEDTVSEETLLGLGAEFYMQVEWLPGGRIEEGELVFDTVMDQSFESTDEQRRAKLMLFEKSRSFILSYIREYGDVEYINIGRLVGSLSLRQPLRGRRGVFLVEVKQHDAAQPFVKILRMQKWGVAEHLDDGKSLLDAMLFTEEYTDYILNRRLACRQLGMNLPAHTTTHKLCERYFGKNRDYHGLTIYSPYFERDYIGGLATDKIPASKFANEFYALAFARLLGHAAAPNLIVGRCQLSGQVIFDDGDEVVVENQFGTPIDIVVADHTGTFTDFRRSLAESAPEYAKSVNKRLPMLSQPGAFAQAYLDAFAERFERIQQEYRLRKRAFDNLFKHQPPVEGGNLSYRWLRVLERMNLADPLALKELIRKEIAIK